MHSLGLLGKGVEAGDTIRPANSATAMDAFSSPPPLPGRFDTIDDYAFLFIGNAIHESVFGPYVLSRRVASEIF